jgi:uncharacterized coiled-coil protein SlyX
MPITHIFTGTAPNDGTGETLREAFILCNDNFDYLDDEIVAAEADIATLESSMLTAQSNITTLQGTVAGHTTSISTINSTLTSLDSRLDAAEPTIVSLDGRLDVVEPLVSGHTTSIATINSTLTSLDSRLDAAEVDINNLETTVASHTTSIGTINSTLLSLDSRLDTAEPEIDALQAADIALDGRLDTAEATLISLDTRLDTAEADIDALQVVDTAYDGRLDALEAADISLDGRLDTAEAELISLDGRVDALEAGGSGDISDAVILAPTTSARNVVTAQNATTAPLTLKAAGSQTAHLLLLTDSSDVVKSTFDEVGRLAINATDPGTNLIHAAGSSYTFEVLASGVVRTGQYDTYVSSNLEARLDQDGLRLKDTGRIYFSSTTAASGSADTILARAAANTLKIVDGSDVLANLELGHLEAYSIDVTELDVYLSSDLKARTNSSGLSFANDFPLIWSSTNQASGSANAGLAWVSSGRLSVTNGSSGSGNLDVGKLFAGDGSTGVPSITFTNDSDTGFQPYSTNTIGVVCGGSLVATLGPFGGGAIFESTVTTIPALVARGSSGHTGRIFDVRNFSDTLLAQFSSIGSLTFQSAASINFSSTTASDGTADVGLKRNSPGIAQVTDGSSGVGILQADRVYLNTGTAADPSLTWYTDAGFNTGLYLRTADSWAASAGGTRRFICNLSPYDLYVDSGFRVAAGPMVSSSTTASLASGSTTNDWAPTNAQVIVVTTGGGTANVTGLSVSQTTGQIVYLVKEGAGSLGIIHASGSSSAGNKFACVGAANITISNHQAAIAIYDGSVWKVGRLT